LFYPSALLSGTATATRVAAQRRTIKRTAFLFFASLLTSIAGLAQTALPPLTSPEVHSDNRVTSDLKGTEHHVTIAADNELRIGPLAEIQGDAAR
jgi:hypothetical protein